MGHLKNGKRIILINRVSPFYFLYAQINGLSNKDATWNCVEGDGLEIPAK